VLYVEEWEFPMPTIAKSVLSRRKIGMDAPKLLILGSAKADLFYERMKYGFKER
jgi:hypothetical protein